MGIPKKVVNLSLEHEKIEDAKRLGLTMSEVAEAAITAKIRKLDQVALQERMDQEMDYWNRFGHQGMTIADEFGIL